MEYEVPALAADATTGVAFNRSGTIRVATIHDPDAEDEKFTLSFQAQEGGTANIDMIAAGGDAIALPTPGATGNPNALTIDDDETQSYDLTLGAGQMPTEGGTVNLTVRADPAHENGSEELRVYLDVQPTIATITTPADGAAITLSNGTDGVDNSMAIVVTLNGNDKNRIEDTITLSAYSGTAGNSTLEDTLSIDVEDTNSLPAVAAMVVDDMGKALDPQPTSVMEGTSVMVALMSVDEDGEATDATEKLTVALTPTGTADGADYTLVGTVTIESGSDSSAAVELDVRGEDDDVGMESLMFDATVSGEAANGTETSMSAAVLSLYIEDATDKKIAPKAEADAYPPITAAIEAGAGEEGLNPGETVTIMTSDLFTTMDGYTASYGVSVDGDSVNGSASGDSVTLEAKMAGPSKVTVTGTARMASNSFMPEQTISNVASITFEVMVVDTELVVTVSAEPMEIAEGGTSMITAAANRAITAGDDGVVIDLTVVGDGELDADSIMIAIGDMSDSVMLSAAEDDDYADGSVTVVATGDGIDGNTQVTIAVTDNDEAPPVGNEIEAKPQDEAYPVITAAIAAGAGEDEMLNPGESVSIMASDLFTVMDGYDATYRVLVDGTAVTGSVSGDDITVMAGAAGEAKVTITGTAKMEMAASSFEASQDATNVASITFPVMVVEPGTEPVPALPLIAQLLLALGLMGGGARLYRRRQG